MACLGSMFEKMGRMTGRSYEDTVQALIKSLKYAEVIPLIYIYAKLPSSSLNHSNMLR